MAELQSTNVTGTLCVNGIAIGGGGKDFKICCVTSSTTWTPPSDLVTGDGMVQAYVIGAGGGGGGYTKQGSVSPKPGGGGAGFVLDTLYQVTSSNDACTVTIGAGGAGGAGTCNDTGAQGCDGGDSCVFDLSACVVGGGAGTPNSGACNQSGRSKGHSGGGVGCSAQFCSGYNGQPGGSAGGYPIYSQYTSEHDRASGRATINGDYVSGKGPNTIGNYATRTVIRQGNEYNWNHQINGTKIGPGVRLFGKIYGTAGVGGCACGLDPNSVQHSMNGRLRGTVAVPSAAEQALCCGDGGGGGGVYYSFGTPQSGAEGADGLVILTWNE